jgi:hypothetical protein
MPKTTQKTTARKSRQQPTEPANKASLPGIVRFSKDVWLTLRKERALFLRLVAFALVLSLLLTGANSYAYYDGLTHATDDVAGQLAAGGLRTLVETGALTVSVISGAASSTLTEVQQLLGGFFYLFIWLVTVWLLRHSLSGNTVKLRDGLYNAGSPLISSCLVVLAGIVQVLPFALIVSLMASVSSTGALSGFVWALVGLALVVVFAALTLYWVAGTVFAAVIVTLPGTYPWAALRSARDVVAGYRRSVVLRLLWLGVMLLAATLAVMVPTVLLDALTGYRLSALVILVLQLANVALFVYGSAYVYLLYRGVIDERS